MIMKIYSILLSTIFFLLNFSAVKSQKIQKGKVVTEYLQSEILQENKINLDTNRMVKVYLPPRYDNSDKSYPVVYFCHNFFWSASQVFENGNTQNLLERGFANNVVSEFIFVAADYSTPTTGSIYGNSPVSGKWLDFTVDELVPFIDSKYRTLKSRNSRALTGDFMGGRGALKLAMNHSDVFGVVYAMHPVATGTGSLPWNQVQIDWEKIYQAKTFSDLGNDGRTQLFVTISQAYLPNLNRPPFYCDFFMEPKGGVPTLHPENVQKTKAGFHLDESLVAKAENLRNLRGLAFDWARFDQTQAHVISNRAFSRKLEDLGIEHEAEEYTGTPWDKNWLEDGRFYSRLLPFFAKHLIF